MSNILYYYILEISQTTHFTHHKL